MYVKNSNGKYKLVDRDQEIKQEKLSSSTAQLTLEELDARLKRLEQIVIDPRK